MSEESMQIVDADTKKECWIEFIWTMFPSGASGYRVEANGEDLGTIIIVDGKLKIVQW